jgi:hypothetical protein
MTRIILIALFALGCSRLPPPSWTDQRCVDLTAQRDGAFWGSLFAGGLAGVSGITAAIPDDSGALGETTARNVRLGIGVGSVVAAAVATSLAALANMKSNEIENYCEYVTVEEDGGTE